MRNLYSGLALAIMALADVSVANAAERFDVVIVGGTVMDPESGLNAVRNVGIRYGKIAALSQERLVGDRIIEAKGLVVAPGFIDLHSHAQNLIGSRVQAFDGVTTALEAEVGQFPIDLAYKKAAAVGRAINYGFSVSWSLARTVVMGGGVPDGTVQGISDSLEAAADTLTAKATEQQNGDILRLLGTGLDQGAVGIGVALGYVPGASEEDVYAVSKLAAERGVTAFVHMRSSRTDFGATQEILANAAVTGAHWHIMHVGWDNVWQEDVLARAAKAGIKVTPETKGWFSGSTYIGATFLEPEALRKIGRPASDIIYYGREISSYEELGRLRTADPKAHILMKVVDDDERNLTKRAETARRLRSAEWVLASDAMPWTQQPSHYLTETTWPLPSNAWAHPRGASTYTRVIQRYVREWKLVDLMDVLRSGSLTPARELEKSVPAFATKGRLKIGCDADIIVFDFNRVEAVATIDKPAALSRGMEYVLVNGALLIEGGRLNKRLRPGRAIRRAFAQ